MPEPESDRCDCNGGEEVSSEFVVARGDPAEVFDLVEEALDKVALAVEFGVDRALDLAASLGRDMRLGAVAGDHLDDGLGVVAAVGDGVSCRCEPVEQRWDAGLVRGLAGADQEAQRQAASVNHGVDLGAQSATRTANGVIRAPLFPPAACWCARTIEVSIR